MFKLFMIIVIIVSAPLSAKSIPYSARHKMVNQSMDIQEQFSADVEKLLEYTAKVLSGRPRPVWPENFRPTWAIELDVFNWADYNINSNSLMTLNMHSDTGDIVVTDVYLLDKATLVLGGHFKRTNTPFVIANKSFQLKKRSGRLTYLDPKELGGFINKFSRLHKQRDMQLKRVADKILHDEKIEKVTGKTHSQIQKHSTPGTVDATWIQSQTASVMINNKLFNKNGMIGEIRIVDIKANKVTFEKDGIQWVQAVGKAPSEMWTQK